MITKKIENTEIKDWYISTFENFETRLNGNADLPLHKIRKEAIAAFDRMGFPSIRMEDWKYTNIQPLLKNQYPLTNIEADLTAADIFQFTFNDLSQNLIVFINGRHIPELSHISADNNAVIIRNLETALKEGNETVRKHISRYAAYEEDPFTALNTAFFREGVFIQIPENQILENPVHILNIAHSQGQLYQSHSRNLIVAGRNSQVKIIQSYHHFSDSHYFHNSVSEIILQEGARVDELKIQNESRDAYRIDRTQIYQENRSIINSISIDLGGAIVRNNLGFSIDGENCKAHLYGFYLLSDRQHVDNHTNIDHLKPNSISNEMYKGILTDSARAVFSGTIFVEKDAQKTNAFQSNKNLLLSDKAEIDSKPQLKIFADDVKCTHGATVGQLDEDAIYYMRQRGINEADAFTLLRSAFAEEILNKINLQPVQEFIRNAINERLKKEF